MGLSLRGLSTGNGKGLMMGDRRPPGESQPGEIPPVLPSGERPAAEAPSKAKPGEATFRVRDTPKAHPKGRKARSVTYRVGLMRGGLSPGVARARPDDRRPPGDGGLVGRPEPAVGVARYRPRGLRIGGGIMKAEDINYYIYVECPYWGTPTGCPISGNYLCGSSPCHIKAFFSPVAREGTLAYVPT